MRLKETVLDFLGFVATFLLIGFGFVVLALL